MILRAIPTADASLGPVAGGGGGGAYEILHLAADAAGVVANVAADVEGGAADVEVGCC